MASAHYGNPISTLGYQILVVVWSFVVLCTITTVLRIIYASRKNGAWRWDFIWASLAYLAAFISASLLTYCVVHGLGNHAANLQFKDLFIAIEWSLPTIYTGSIAICFSKFAVVSLLMDVLSGATYKKQCIALWIVAASFAVTTILQIAMTTVQCRPYKKIWIQSLPGDCDLKQITYTVSYIHAAVGAASDILLALWPVTIVWNLKISRNLKISFCLLMAIGILPGIASCYRVYLLKILVYTNDYTYDGGDFLLWATVEVGSLILLGAIPPLRQPFLRFGSFIAKHVPVMGAFFTIKGTTRGTEAYTLEKTNDNVQTAKGTFTRRTDVGASTNRSMNRGKDPYSRLERGLALDDDIADGHDENAKGVHKVTEFFVTSTTADEVLRQDGLDNASRPPLSPAAGSVTSLEESASSKPHMSRGPSRSGPGINNSRGIQ